MSRSQNFFESRHTLIIATFRNMSVNLIFIIDLNVPVKVRAALLDAIEAANSKAVSRANKVLIIAILTIWISLHTQHDMENLVCIGKF